MQVSQFIRFWTKCGLFGEFTNTIPQTWSDNNSVAPNLCRIPPTNPPNFPCSPKTEDEHLTLPGQSELCPVYVPQHIKRYIRLSHHLQTMLFDQTQIIQMNSGKYRHCRHNYHHHWQKAYQTCHQLLWKRSTVNTTQSLNQNKKCINFDKS